MASIIQEPNGRKTIQFTDPGDKQRRPKIHLGKVTLREAQFFKHKIERLISSRITGDSLDADTSQWIAALTDDIAEKLAHAGLVAGRQRRAQATLKPWLDDYLARRVDVKPATREVWRQIVRNLTDHFGEDRELATITEGDAEDFKLFLVQEGLASTTVHKRLQFARMFFRAALKRKLIAANPFSEVTAVAVINADRQYFLKREDVDRLLEACDPTWRTIVTLCRYGGLRCPSEVLSLHWQDVNWESSKIVVHSPKTEHHPGKASRVIPLFAELRPFLVEAKAIAVDGAPYVVDGDYRTSSLSPSGWRNCNLRTQFERIIKRAGLKPWPRLFHAMRASRETELAQEFPLHVVTAWLGNTPRIAMKHYLQVTDADFVTAAGVDGKSGAASPDGGALDDLRLITEAWPTLSNSTRAAMLVLLRSKDK